MSTDGLEPTDPQPRTGDGLTGAWLHASLHVLRIGDWVRPPEETGCPPASWGPSLPSALERGHYRLDRVYLIHSEGKPARDQVGRFQFTTDPDVRIYEVEPDGELEPDPDPTVSGWSTFRCCPRALVIRRVWPPMTQREELAERVDSLLARMGAVIAGTDYLPSALARYSPSVPPQFHYRTVLDEESLGLAFVHELCHTCVHPPGSADGDPSNRREERCAHAAAELICASRGVHGYTELMTTNRVLAEPLESGDQELVDIMIARVEQALAAPHVLPAWGEPVDPIAWRAARDAAADAVAAGQSTRPVEDLVRPIYDLVLPQLKAAMEPLVKGC